MKNISDNSNIIHKGLVKNRISLAMIALVLAITMIALSSCSFIAGGSSGQNGIDGADGINGADGKSAYEIALANGFTGSESEWLESLKGLDGKDGANGTLSAGTSEALQFIVSEYKKEVEAGYKGSFKEYLESCVSSDYTSNLYVNKNLMSSVAIYCTFKVKQSTSFPFGSGTIGEATSAGSGVIYKLDKNAGTAYIITNYHVVYNSSSTAEDKISDNISVYLYGDTYLKSKITAEYIGGSMNYDIAVLKITGNDLIKNSDARAVSIADSLNVLVGDSAIAIGNAEGLGISATTGTISVDSEYIQMTAVDGYTLIKYRVMRIDTAINSGNSGGGLFNSKGELIGIVNAKTSDTSVEGIGYAIPSNIVAGVAQNIIDNCEGKKYTCVRKCTVGVTLEPESSYAKYDEANGKATIIEKVKVAEVGAGTVSDGKLKTGDIIKSVTVSGKKTDVTRMFTIIDALLDVREGDTVQIEVERAGKTEIVEIKFTEKDLTDYK